MSAPNSFSEAMKHLRERPCKCVACDFCRGNGQVECSTNSHPEWELESCDECEGGISQVCDRCREMEDLQADEDERNFARPIREVAENG